MANGWGGARSGAGRKLDPETIEHRAWCRRLLKSKPVRDQIKKHLKSKDPAVSLRALHEIIVTAHPVPTELSGIIESGRGVLVVVPAAKFGVQV